jgi:hypothetical protein
MTESSLVNTAFGWALVLGVTGVSYYYYNQSAPNKRPQRNTRTTFTKETDPQRSRAKQANGQNISSDGASSSKQSDKAQNRAKKPKSDVPTRPVPTMSTSYDEPEPEDNSWAQELANKQKGTTFTSQKQSKSRQKTVKQTSANKVAAEISGETSTTGGAEADDDFSPAVSPGLPFTESKIAINGDVQDMLEAPAPGPSVLRITKPEEFLPVSRKPKSKAPRQEEESKKQRQNRKKVEENKARREEEEKMRRVQLEKQLRTARESRGEPAKNGLASKAPASNAWDKAKQNPVAAPVNGNGGFLDTFEPEVEVPKQKVATNGTNSSGWASRPLPSEEEQMRIIAENDDSAWTTVEKNGRKAKKRTTDGSGSENGGSVEGVEMNGNHVNGIH